MRTALSCLVLAALLLAGEAGAQSSCTPSSARACLTIEVSSSDRSGVSVCLYSNSTRTTKVGSTQTTDAQGKTTFSVAAGRYWGRAYKGSGSSRIGRDEPDARAVQANQSASEQIQLYGSFTGSCDTTASGGGTSGGGSTGPSPTRGATTGPTVLGAGPQLASPEQMRASAASFSSYNSIYSHPRCTNCHGGVNPTAGTNHPATSAACSSCHTITGWRLASSTARFAGKTWSEICNAVNQSAQVQSLAAWTEHVEHDPLIAWAFSPTGPQRNPSGPAPRGLAFFKEESLKRYDPTARKLRCALFTPLKPSP
jgi:hypothetical protein